MRKNNISYSKMTESYKYYSGKEAEGKQFKRLTHRNERHRTKRALSRTLWNGEIE